MQSWVTARHVELKWHLQLDEGGHAAHCGGQRLQQVVCGQREQQQHNRSLTLCALADRAVGRGNCRQQEFNSTHHAHGTCCSRQPPDVRRCNNSSYAAAPSRTCKVKLNQAGQLADGGGQGHQAVALQPEAQQGGAAADAVRQRGQLEWGGGRTWVREWEAGGCKRGVPPHKCMQHTNAAYHTAAGSAVSPEAGQCSSHQQHTPGCSWR